MDNYPVAALLCAILVIAVWLFILIAYPIWIACVFGITAGWFTFFTELVILAFISYGKANKE